MINRRRCLGHVPRGNSETSERRSSVRGHVVRRRLRPFATPPLSYTPLCAQINVLLHYLHLLRLFFVVLVAGPVEDGIGMLVGWNLSWYVRCRPFLADVFLYLTGIDFLQDAEGGAKTQNTDVDPSCGGGDPQVDQRIVASVDS